MIKEETYNQVATEFATAIGVAHVIGYKNKREQIKEGGIESFKRIEPDLEINAIVCDSIEFDLYQELQRSIYEIRKTKKKLKEIKNEYSEYPVGHGVAPQNFFSFKKWIENRL